jgi:ABC-type transporter Mla subunit MlaD
VHVNARISRASQLGAAAVAAVLVVLAVGFFRPRLSDNSVVVRAQFGNAAEIARFDRTVRVAGVDLGTIGSVKRQGSVAIVELRFPPGAIGPIHADATADLRPHTVFDGTAYVDFSTGSPSAPLLGGRTIGLAHTQNYVSLDLALRVAGGQTRADLRAALRDLASSLSGRTVASLRDTFVGQPQLFAAVAPAMRALQGPSRRELAGVIHGFAATSAALATETGSFGPLLRSTAQTIRAMRVDNGQALDQTLVALPPALDSAAAGGSALYRIVDRLQPLAAQLTPAMSELTPTLAELRPVLADALSVLEPTTSFVAELRRTVTDAGAAAIPTRSVLDALDPTIGLLSDNLLPFLRSRARAGVPIYSQLAAVGASAGASMSGVRSPTVAQANNTGSGHGWHFYSAFLSGSSGRPTCSTVPASIMTVISQLGLCVP